LAARGQTAFPERVGLQLKTRSKSWQPVAEELWRFLLYSEFVFDLPCPLPAALADVPCAPDAARPLVEDLCERLRSDRRIDSLYIERAEAIELALALPTVCRELTDLGVRDTFPFEERSFSGRQSRPCKATRSSACARYWSAARFGASP